MSFARHAFHFSAVPMRRGLTIVISQLNLVMDVPRGNLGKESVPFIPPHPSNHMFAGMQTSPWVSFLSIAFLRPVMRSGGGVGA